MEVSCHLKRGQRVLFKSASQKLINLHFMILTQNTPHVHLAYGTAGFRGKDSTLARVAFRVGEFMSVLSRARSPKWVGVMVTASHNQIGDNGVKLSNEQGHMMQAALQKVVQNFCNSEESIESLEKQLSVQGDRPGQVLIGGDSRPSTQHLKFIIRDALSRRGIEVIDIGLCSTPQLHFSVMLKNKFPQTKDLLSQYSKLISDSYNRADQLLVRKSEGWTVDCANGAGAYNLATLGRHCNLPLRLINYKDWRLINDRCGSQFIQKERQAPSEMPTQGNCFASFDGDADRIVLFTRQPFRVLEGDWISYLFILLFSQCFRNIRGSVPTAFQQCKIGVVQTMYSNTCSTELIQATGAEVKLAATGVKYLHRKVVQFDIGVYFQPNGHGAIYFSQKYELELKEIEKNSQLADVKLLRLLLEINNPTVGDAVTNLLIADLALRRLSVSLLQFSDKLKENPCKSIKVKVAKKHLVKVTEVEDRVVQPLELQELIDEAVKTIGLKKAFVRPSGTEDVLRLHVEAEDQKRLEEGLASIQKSIMRIKQIN